MLPILDARCDTLVSQHSGFFAFFGQRLIAGPTQVGVSDGQGSFPGTRSGPFP
jgi:hypothetical protein